MHRWVAHARAVDVIKACSAVVPGERLSYRCDELEPLARDLSGGLLDLAFLCEVKNQVRFRAVKEWRESAYWVASPTLRLSPGEPIPLIGWPGSFTDRTAIKAFEALGLQCRIAFASPDMGVRVAAAEEGAGVMLANGRCVSDRLEIVRLPYLPPPPQLTTGVYVRDGLDTRRYQSLIRAFEDALKPVLIETHSGKRLAVDNGKARSSRQRRSASI
jgi:DNA-binding transcriptional LysR family regulator